MDVQFLIVNMICSIPTYHHPPSALRYQTVRYRDGLPDVNNLVLLSTRLSRYA